MEHQSKALEYSQQNFISPGNNQRPEFHLPPLSKNTVIKASSFASITKMDSSQVSPLCKSHVKGYESRTFEEKLGEKMKFLSKDAYKYLQTGEIYKEYRMLKEELKNLGEQLNRIISLKNFNRTIKQSPSEKNSLTKSRCFEQSQCSNCFEPIYDGFQKNNEKILQNSSMELTKLMHKSSHILQHDPAQMKEQLRQKVISAREELNKEKRNFKHLILESQKVGNEILNTDKMIEEMRLLEDDLKILLLRKKKLEEQIKINRIRREKIENVQEEIYQKQYELEEFQETKKQKNIQTKNQQLLCSEATKKLRIIAALKKDIEAKGKIKAKQYYNLLNELNKIEQNQLTLNNRYEKLQKSIELTKQQSSELQSKYASLKTQASRPRLFKEVSGNVERNNETKNSFYKSKRNLETNEVQPKDLLKEIEEHLSQTHKKLQDIEKKASTKHLQNSKSRSQNFQHETSAFQIDKQNNHSISFLHSTKKDVESLQHKKTSLKKKYQQLSDSQILEQQQEDILEESIKRNAQQLLEDIELKEEIQIDEEILF